MSMEKTKNWAVNRRIIGLSFINAHRALYAGTQTCAEMFRRKGFQADAIDLTAPHAIEELNECLYPDEVAFCFGLQGVGSRLGNKEQTIWKQRKIPFVGIHIDNPCYNIFNHFSDTPYVANLYHYESFADIHRRYIQSDQIVDVLPFQMDDIGPSPIPFRERPIKLLYLKAYEPIKECIHNLNSLTPSLRDAVWQQLERAQRYPNFQICDLVQETFDQLHIVRAQNFDLFWGCAHWMDMYLRRKRAVDFVDWLKMQEGAVIVGDGWDVIDRSKAKAIFKPSIDISGALNLYRQCQSICNTSPYGRDVLHERTVAGLLNESIVISDTNAWWDEKFGNIPALKRFDWGQPLDDQLRPAISISMTEAEAQAPTGRPLALKHFTGLDMAEKILDCVQQIKKRVGEEKPPLPEKTKELSNIERRQRRDIINLWKYKSSLNFEFFEMSEKLRKNNPQWNTGIFFDQLQKLDLTYTAEIACGFGFDAELIVDKCKALYLIDTSVDAIAHARNRFKDKRHVKLILSDDGTSLPGIPDNRLTAVFSYMSMMFFEPLTIACYLKEIERVLVPGGRALLHHSNYAGNPTGHMIESPHWRNYMTQELMAHLASRAGLKIVVSLTSGKHMFEMDALTLLEKEGI